MDLWGAVDRIGQNVKEGASMSILNMQSPGQVVSPLLSDKITLRDGRCASKSSHALDSSSVLSGRLLAASNGLDT